MLAKNSKALLFATLWVLVVGSVGIASEVHSLLSWFVLASVAVLPTVMLFRWFRTPSQSMSEIIQEGRR